MLMDYVKTALFYLLVAVIVVFAVFFCRHLAFAVAAHLEPEILVVDEVQTGLGRTGALFGSMTLLENVRLPLEEYTACGAKNPIVL